MSRTVRIATRGSKLALWQAHHVRDRLLALQEVSDVELLIVKTKGDAILDVPLAKVGGKGLFVKEIEQALLDERADVAVHSMKDVPAELAPGLHMAAISQREDPRDALCCREAASLAELPHGATVGTSSLRRVCQIRALRPDLQIDSLRGNVPTRLGKLQNGDFDAIVLAVAGLVRLELGDSITEAMAPEQCLPAVGQGALGIETRAADTGTSELVAQALHHETDARRIVAERRFLAELEGGCHAPLAGYCDYTGSGELRLRALIGTPDGSTMLRAEGTGDASAPAELGTRVARDLLAQGGGDILKSLPAD